MFYASESNIILGFNLFLNLKYYFLYLVSVTEVEKALLSEIEKKPPREKPHTKPRRSSDPSANYPPTETRKPRKASELKGGSRKRNDSEGNLESKSPKPKDLKQAQAISSPTRSVESNQNQSSGKLLLLFRCVKIVKES